MRGRVAYLMAVLSCTLFLGGEMTVLQGYEGPLPEKKIDSYSDIAFKLKNFQEVKRGLTRENVLELLGKPIRITKEKRRSNRWTVHYFYPEGHVVNFKDGLVVGKE